MDRGRQIDSIQNQNAVYIDNYGETRKTSVKIANPPGGRSNFSLGWGDDSHQQQEKPKYGRKRFEPNQNSLQNNVHTSVKVSHNPGGKSNIVFGTDQTSYEDYRK